MGRVLALDPGTDRIGVAVTDADRIAAHPRPALDARDERLFDDIEALVGDLDVDEIVVGLPVSLDGSEGPSAVAARSFAAAVAERTGIPTVLYDERFSSVIAERALLETGARRSERRRRRDGVAAALFLEDYLESRR
jgi:putative holliday junction resolvase